MLTDACKRKLCGAMASDSGRTISRQLGAALFQLHSPLQPRGIRSREAAPEHRVVSECVNRAACRGQGKHCFSFARAND